MRSGRLLLWLLVLSFGTSALPGQTRVWTREEILSRTVNPSREYQLEAWPAHTIVGNVHYVGTRNLGSFLITTPDGHILINSTFEETLPRVMDSVSELGFDVEDIRIILGSHAHGDHMEGNIRLKQLTGAEVMVMAEDIPLLERMGSPDTPQPIDRILSDGDQVSIGETTLTARLTPGHTPGTTTWVMTAEEDGSSYGVVVLGGGVTARSRLAGNPELQDQFNRMFEVNRSLDCDVPLGPHTPMYRMEEKYARLGDGPNPFIDPEICQEEMFLQEQSFRFRLEEQQRQLDEGQP